jgi:hypothetical protein
MVIAILKMESKQKVNLPGAATLPEGLNILLTRVLFKVKNKKHQDKIPLPGVIADCLYLGMTRAYPPTTR